MKKILPSTSRTLVSIACIILAFFYFNFISDTNRAKAMASLVTVYYYLSGEDSLNVNGDTLRVASANNRFKLKDTSLYIVVGGRFNSIDSLADQVDTLYMRSLYDSAYHKNTGGHFVTILHIKFGLHNHAIRLYYKPLCFTRDSTSKPGASPAYGYYSDHNQFDSNYYYYSSGIGFVRAPYKNQFLKDSLNYIDSIRIRHHLNNTTPGYFYGTNNDSGDVHCVSYTFQEVYSLIKNNSGSHYVKVSNIGQRVPVLVGGSNVNFYKHSVMMGPNSQEPGGHGAGGGSGVYYNVYADLGNLCPPSCGEQQFTLK